MNKLMYLLIIIVFIPGCDRNNIHTFTKTYGGNLSEFGLLVQQTKDGGYIVVGRTKSFGEGANDVYLVKTDEHGNELWSKVFGGKYDDIGNFVQQTSDSGYIIVGETSSFGAGKENVYLIKTDPEGNEEWSIFMEYLNDAAFVQQTLDGGYIIVGFTVSFGVGRKDIMLIKTDANGKL